MLKKAASPNRTELVCHEPLPQSQAPAPAGETLTVPASPPVPPRTPQTLPARPTTGELGRAIRRALSAGMPCPPRLGSHGSVRSATSSDPDGVTAVGFPPQDRPFRPCLRTAVA